MTIAVLGALLLVATIYFTRRHEQVPVGEPIVALPKTPSPEEFSALEREAAAGNSDAQLRLANQLIFWNGSQLRALDLMRAAASQGNPDAEFALGRILLGEIAMWERDPEGIRRGASSTTEQGVWLEKPGMEGLWLIERPEEGVYWLESAANHGQTSAWRELAGLYKGGKGIGRNPERSAYWVHKLADAGDPFEILEYAKLLESGDGNSRDPIQALGWVYLVVAAPYPPDSAIGGSARQMAKRMEAMLTPHEIAAAREQTKVIATRTSVCVGWC